MFCAFTRFFYSVFMDYPFHFSLLSSLGENTFPDIFFEIQKKEDIDSL